MPSTGSSATVCRCAGWFGSARATAARPGQGAKLNGDNPEGAKPDGDNPQGAKPDSDNPEGAEPDSDDPEGAKPDSDNPEGANPAPTGTAGDKPTTPPPAATRQDTYTVRVFVDTKNEERKDRTLQQLLDDDFKYVTFSRPEGATELRAPVPGVYFLTVGTIEPSRVASTDVEGTTDRRGLRAWRRSRRSRSCAFPTSWRSRRRPPVIRTC
ncbi:MAG: hypothetical protein ACLP0J_31145 [Solirubrobacteraceae bacterium]|jgi:hypothetical protein